LFVRRSRHETLKAPIPIQEYAHSGRGDTFFRLIFPIETDFSIHPVSCGQPSQPALRKKAPLTRIDRRRANGAYQHPDFSSNA
jgi:hypothetical protein